MFLYYKLLYNYQALHFPFLFSVYQPLTLHIGWPLCNSFSTNFKVQSSSTVHGTSLLNRANNFTLMTQVPECLIDITSPLLTLPQLKKLNSCWLYWSLFCTETCGYLGAHYSLCSLLQAFLPPTNSPTVHTTKHINYLGVLYRSIDTPLSIQECLLQDWNDFKEVMQVRYSNTRTMKVQHIKNHLDYARNAMATLPLQARLNILSNAGTHKAYMDYLIFHQGLFSPSTLVASVLNSCHITSIHLSWTSITYYTPIMLAYFKEKHYWAEEIFLPIDWLASGKECNSSPKNIG